MTSDTKERILDAAERLFADHGFPATSMRDITQEAGVNLAAVNGVVARILPGPHALHRPARHKPRRYDAGLPSSVIRFRMLQARTASLPCPAGLRARRPLPMIDLYRKKAFSTRAC